MAQEKTLLKQTLERLDSLLRENTNIFKPLIGDLGRMMRMSWDIVRGRFKASPTQIAIIMGALAYVVFPFDAVPDMIPFAGLIDDAAVLTAAMLKLSELINKWEGVEDGIYRYAGEQEQYEDGFFEDEA